MDTRGGSPRFHELLAMMGDVHVAKNADYSPGADPFGNFREAEAIGVPAWVGAWIRLQDKYKRAQGFVRQLVEEGSYTAAVVSEKLDDTVMDLANYSVIVRCLYEEWLAQLPTEGGEVAIGNAICTLCGDSVPIDETLFMGDTYVCRKCSEEIYISVASRIQQDLMRMGVKNEGRDKS